LICKWVGVISLETNLFLIFLIIFSVTAIAKYHVIKGVHCGASTIMTSGLKTLQGGYITFRCKFNGNYINDAKVLAEDVISSNGVVHLIDQVLLPDSGT
jgi:uncharacterized surface protein with fasciclin (FAS1) repeats